MAKKSRAVRETENLLRRVQKATKHKTTQKKKWAAVDGATEVVEMGDEMFKEGQKKPHTP